MYSALVKKFCLLCLLFLLLPAFISGAGVTPEEQHFQAGLKFYLKGETAPAVTELTQSLRINPGYEQAQALLTLISGKRAAALAVPAAPPAIEPAVPAAARSITLELRNADLNDVLRLFAQEYGLNIVAGKEVAGTVTISFTDVPVEEALRAILGVNGFGYEKVDNLVMVGSLTSLSSRTSPLTAGAFVTRVVTLHYISAEKAKAIVQRQLSAGGTVDVMTDFYVGGWEMGGVSGGQTQKDIGQKQRAKSADEEKPRVLVVTDFPNVVDRVEKIVRELDVKPPQITIDAMLVEIDSNYVRDIGIDWSVDRTADNNLKSGFTSLPAVSDPDYFTKGLLLDYLNSPLEVTIKALENQGKANILSNPRIMTLDNYPAVILVGEMYPIMTNTVTPNTSGPPTITGALDHYQPIGVSLRVLPRVNINGAIDLILHPEVTSLGENVASSTGEGALVLPIINTREADTSVTVKNGQTAVIGGLLTRETHDTYNKIPFLGDIPVLGYLFKGTHREPKKSELLIFITPRVVNQPADASDLLREKTAELRERTANLR